MKFRASTSNPPIGGLITLKAANVSGVELEWGKETSLEVNPEVQFKTSNSISRYLARRYGQSALYGSNIIQQCEIDHWLSFSIGELDHTKNFKSCLDYLDKCLANVTFLVGNKYSIADFVVWGSLFNSTEWVQLTTNREVPSNVTRWYSLIKSLDFVSDIISSLPEKLRSKDTLEGMRKEEGKFVDLPGAEMGKVVVRFPPEASGYLHIGHAKAALLNQYYKEAFNGKLIMRFDDTNPAKEKVDFEKVILGDLDLLEIKPDEFTHTSNYFDLMLDYCQRMIEEKKAYVDDTDPETMKKEREQKLASKNRENSVEKNLQMWNEMKNGTELGQKCCVRAKIDMNSPNGCMRDPTIYRCKNEPHPRTGTKYKVYPTYDFACPIVDSIEGVTHCLRTMEYHDRDDQFYWFIDALGLRKPYIWEYARLNMTNTVLSKRKLTWFVENKQVDGWDDPRFPTVRGVVRRGMTVEGLKQFVIAQGSSRSVVVMEWDKIWAFNKKVIDPVAPRFSAVSTNSNVVVHVCNVNEEAVKVPKHPKNPDIGEKTVWLGPKLIIDEQDAEDFKENSNVTFINWGNLRIKKVVRKDNKITEVLAEPNLDDKDYKKTMKITWLAETKQAPLVPCICVYFEHIINKAVLGKEEDFKQYIGHCTKVEVPMLGDPELATLKKSEIIQIQRKGFFICDSPYEPVSLHTGRPSPLILFSVPDGHTKQMPTCGPPKTQQKENEEVAKAPPQAVGNAAALFDKIKSQGDLVRDLKQKKAEKSVVDVEVKKLLGLKSEFKKVYGQDWKPDLIIDSKKSVEEEPPQGDGDASAIFDKIKSQGDLVRDLKQKKAEKSVVDVEVKTLLGLKSEFKKVYGQDWKPDLIINSKESVGEVPPQGDGDASAIFDKIKSQGDLVRDLKQKKAEKSVLDVEVKKLLALKSEFKKVYGQDWKPDLIIDSKKSVAADSVKPVNPQKPASNIKDLLDKITEVGNKIRKLKSDKVDKNVVAEEVKALLELKSSFKMATGQDWKPDVDINKLENISVLEKSSIKSDDKNETEKKVSQLTIKINEQGNIVRDLKSSGASKEEINSQVQLLLNLKNEYKSVSGKDFPTERKAPSKEKGKEKSPEAKTPLKEKSKEKLSKPVKPKKEEKTSNQNNETVGQTKKVTRLCLEAKKEENLPDWYSQVIVKGEMIEYFDVSGCYILRPWSFEIWEKIREWLDHEIKKLGVKNCYFPIFVSKSVLEKEKTHIADFAPEVAWVTKSGDSDLAEPIAIRPTSETVMYPSYAKWVQSYRDLPIRLNQWNNVVRWEFKHPQPFLRTREFLWQEGHTAFAGMNEALEEVNVILDLYAKIYTDLLAIPVVKGRKTEKEKFAGGDFTLTVEAYISASGRAIQGATSHHLGQNFSKMFEIVFDDPVTQERCYVYQNSWGITTRTIGVLIMVHGDNQGLVLPPKVASIQVVIVPCGLTVNLKDSEKEEIINACKETENVLVNSGIKVYGDYRDNYSPGWKFNHWELKGVPVRVEIGPKDMKLNQVQTVRRDSGLKETVSKNSLVDSIHKLLDTIQADMLKKASKELQEHMVVCKEWKDFCQHLDQKNIILAPFCGEINCEDTIKQNSAREDQEDSGAPSMGAKGLCIPFDQPNGGIKDEDRCINPECKLRPKFYTLFGRSY